MAHNLWAMTNRGITSLYQKYLQTTHWEEIRAAALFIAADRCQLCGRGYGLQVHHNTYERLTKELPSDTVVLCELCHKTFHSKLALMSVGLLECDAEALASFIASYVKSVLPFDPANRKCTICEAPYSSTRKTDLFCSVPCEKQAQKRKKAKQRGYSIRKQEETRRKRQMLWCHRSAPRFEELQRFLLWY